MSPFMYLLVALTLQGPEASPPAPQQPDAVGQAYYLFLQGRSQEGRDDVAGAIASYRQALEILPDSAAIRVELAGLYAQQGQIPEARSEAERALTLEEGNREAHRLLGWIQSATLDRVPSAGREAAAADAARHLERAIAAGASDPSTRIALAGLYVRQRDAVRAEPILARVLEDEPGFPPALRLQAMTYQLLGRPADAARVMAALRAGQPDAVEVRVRQIDRLERQGSWREAAAAWVEVVGRSDGGALYRARYALALAQSGSIDAARPVLAEAVLDAPKDAGVWYLVAQIETRAGRAFAAEDAARRIAAIDPADLRGPLVLAEVRAAQNDDRGVVRALEAPVEKAKDDQVATGFYALAVRTLARAHSRLDQHRQAVSVLERARLRAPDDDALPFLLASAYQENRQFAPAERIYREILSGDPGNATALNDLGYMFADRGERLEESVELVTKALAAEPDNPAFLDSLGWAYFKMNRLEEATSPLERAATMLPRVSVIQDHLGDLYAGLKKYREAAEAFERALNGDRDGIDAQVITRKRDRMRLLLVQP